MKTFAIGIFVLFAGFITYVIYDELSYDPLNKMKFNKLFNDDNNYQPKMICSKDLLGLSIRGELFDIYRYKVSIENLDATYPKLIKWENEKVTKNTVVQKWKKIDFDATTLERFKLILTTSNFNRHRCSSSFKHELENKNNYFSYIYFDDMEKFFLLYSSQKKELYYVRQRGF